MGDPRLENRELGRSGACRGAVTIARDPALLRTLIDILPDARVK